MGWINKTDSKENKVWECHLYEVLHHDDDNRDLGCIMQFFEEHPYYAISYSVGRLGPHETLEEARAAVEDPSKARPLALFIPSKEGMI